jgi:predicted RNA-binding protein YlxR (DUF448 family)
MATAETHVAVRTCVGCGSRAAQSELLRLQPCGVDELERVIRPHGGRSAYLHARRACLDKVSKRRLLARSLRRTLPRERFDLLRARLLADLEIGISEA